MPEPRTFTIGITMAGAVSAGAYTAGVLDYLFRALDHHAARLAAGGPGAPQHRVVLKVMSGASAGGVCSGLAIAALARAQRDGPDRPGEPALNPPAPALITGPDGSDCDVSVALGPLYDVWIRGLDLWRPVPKAGFLALDDLANPDDPLRSALDSTHIDAVAGEALSGIRWSGRPLPFLADELELFLTTTNLQGVPYKISFSAGEGAFEHRMAQHSTVRHFRVSGMGSQSRPSDWLTDWGDEGISLDLAGLGDGPIPFDGEGPWGLLKQASIATGAFPIGLAARRIDATAGDFSRFDAATSRGGALPLDIPPDRLVHARPDFGVAGPPETAIPYIAVDGGVANNEPFEYARFTLRDAVAPDDRQQDGQDASRWQYLEPNPRDPENADRAVIMIDPFPEGPEYTPLMDGHPMARRDLLAALKALLPALMNQARFKPSELASAGDPDIRSRFLIAPVRNLDDDRQLIGAEAIASGGLGGFGGFVDETFRRHDFVLGQRNCQKFLQDHFVLSERNPIFYPDGQVPDTARAEIPRAILDPGPGIGGPIDACPWPRIDAERLDLLMRQARVRMRKVVKKVLADLAGGFFARVGLNIGWLMKWDDVRKAMTAIVMSDLIARDQHAGYADATPERRAAVLALIARGDAAATAAELMQGLPAGAPRFTSTAALEDDLRALVASGQLWSARPLTGSRRYAHAQLKPGLTGATRLRLFGGRPQPSGDTR